MKKLIAGMILVLALSGASFADVTLSTIVKSGATHTASVSKRVGKDIWKGLKATGHFLMASDGGPMPMCRPGTPCKPDDLLRPTV